MKRMNYSKSSIYVLAILIILVLALLLTVVFRERVAFSPVTDNLGMQVCICFADITWVEECRTSENEPGIQKYRQVCKKDVTCKKSKQGGKAMDGLLKPGKEKVGDCVPT